MDKLDIFQSRFGKNRQIWMVGLRKNFSRYRVMIYLHRFQIIIPNSRSSIEVRSYITPGNKWTGQSNTENVEYNCTLTYGTCKSFGSVYSFIINVYNISYFTVTTNQRYDKLKRKSDHAI